MNNVRIVFDAWRRYLGAWGGAMGPQGAHLPPRLWRRHGALLNSAYSRCPECSHRTRTGLS